MWTITSVKIPAATSSTITKNAPFLMFSKFIGKGFRISKILKIPRLINIQKGVKIRYGFDNAINIPITSSITIEEWSNPFTFSYVFIELNPIMDNTRTKISDEYQIIYPGKNKIVSAAILPKVPGAYFILPIKNTVTVISSIFFNSEFNSIPAI